MKRLLIILCIALNLAACKNQSQNDTFRDNKGEMIRLSALKGKWVIINYWATWCHSCIEEIPQLNAFYQAHKKRVVMLGVNYDMPKPAKLNAAIKKFKITYPVLTEDPRKTLKLEDAGVIPTTYIFNPQGKLIKRLLGPQTTKTLKKITGLT